MHEVQLRIKRYLLISRVLNNNMEEVAETEEVAEMEEVVRMEELAKMEDFRTNSY